MARIFIESTWKGPAKRDGVAIWLVEVGNQTMQGFVHLESGTEIRGNLMAMINAFFVLKKWHQEEASASVFTQCESILHTIQNHWHIQWQKNDWRNAKGKPVKNQDLWEMYLEKSAAYAYTVAAGHHEYANVMQIELQKEFKRWKGEGNE